MRSCGVDQSSGQGGCPRLREEEKLTSSNTSGSYVHVSVHKSFSGWDLPLPHCLGPPVSLHVRVVFLRLGLREAFWWRASSEGDTPTSFRETFWWIPSSEGCTPTSYGHRRSRDVVVHQTLTARLFETVVSNRSVSSTFDRVSNYGVGPEVGDLLLQISKYLS